MIPTLTNTSKRHSETQRKVRALETCAYESLPGYVVTPDILLSIPALMATGTVANVKKIYHLAIVAYWFIPFFWRNPDYVVRPQVLTFFRGLKTSHPDLPVGAAGFCWGGKWTIELCSARHRATPPVGNPQPQSSGQSGGEGAPLVVCGFTAHPSRLTYPNDIEAVELPLSIAASGKFDPQMTREQGEQTRGILEAKSKKGAGEVEHEFVWYEGASHGFAVRADEDDTEEAERGKKAEKQAIDWFTRWFGGSK